MIRPATLEADCFKKVPIPNPNTGKIKVDFVFLETNNLSRVGKDYYFNKNFMNEEKKQIIPIEKFITAGEWFEFCRAYKLPVPIQAGMQISRRMKEKNLPFPEAYYECLQEGLIVESEKVNVVIVARV